MGDMEKRDGGQESYSLDTAQAVGLLAHAFAMLGYRVVLIEDVQVTVAIALPSGAGEVTRIFDVDAEGSDLCITTEHVVAVYDLDDTDILDIACDMLGAVMDDFHNQWDRDLSDREARALAQAGTSTKS